MRVLGLDIGGANLKAASANGHAVSRPFAIWKYPERLADELRQLESAVLPGASAFAVTMTAELADCYETKAAGVSQILSAVQKIAQDRPVLVWLTKGGFAPVAEVAQQPLLAAASNWHALATYAGRFVQSTPTILMDIGTTTTDLIPIDQGRPSTRGQTDVTRLLAGELVYTGVRRTPLCAVAPAVPFRGAMCPLSSELFATTLDIHLWLDQIPEDPVDVETANGRPATKAAAHDRIARQLCGDREEVTAEDVTTVARFLAAQQRAQIATALDQVLANRPARDAVILSGSGMFLVWQIIADHPQLRDANLLEVNPQQSVEAAVASCAYAVAVLAEEEMKYHRA